MLLARGRIKKPHGRAWSSSACPRAPDESRRAAVRSPTSLGREPTPSAVPPRPRLVLRPRGEAWAGMNLEPRPRHSVLCSDDPSRGTGSGPRLRASIERYEKRVLESCEQPCAGVGRVTEANPSESGRDLVCGVTGTFFFILILLFIVYCLYIYLFSKIVSKNVSASISFDLGIAAGAFSRHGTRPRLARNPRQDARGTFQCGRLPAAPVTISRRRSSHCGRMPPRPPSV